VSETTHLSKRAKKTRVPRTASAPVAAHPQYTEGIRSPERETAGPDATQSSLESVLLARKLQGFIDAAPEGVAIYDPAGQLVRSNARYRALLALFIPNDHPATLRDWMRRSRARDAQGRRLTEAHWPHTRILRGEVIATEHAVEMMLSTLEGEAARLHVSGAPVRADDGRVMGAYVVHVVHRDLTTQRQLAREASRQHTVLERVAVARSAQLQATFDALAEPMCVFDADGRILRQNRAERELFGFDTPPATIEERAAWIDLRDAEGLRIPPEQLPARMVLAGATLAGIDAPRVVARGADGGDHWFLLGGAPLCDDAGAVIGGVIIFHDITERRQLGRQLRWQASMLERAHDAIFMWELDGPIVSWNHGAELLYGYTKEEAVGQRSDQLLQTERPNSEAEFKEALERDGEWIGEIYHTTADGRRLAVESRRQLLVEPDRQRYALEICRDITERLELEAELRRSHEDLEQQVHARTRKLASANRLLRRLSRQVLEAQETERRRVARELHDEIGQALTGVKLLLETSSRRNAAKMNSALAGVGDAIDEALTRVRELSLDLRPAMLDSLGLLPTLLWRFETYTSQTGIQVAFHHAGLEQRFAPEVETGAYRVIQEALTNVARHAAVPVVRVELEATDQALRIYVIDEGLGFDAEEVIASGRSTGLAGMRERATLLGGTFVLSSAPGAGATIEVALPLTPEGDAETAQDAVRDGEDVESL
jgi:PAS domain S-box-containing protein